MSKQDQHHWSGWPGAYCLKCHCEDPMEIALTDGDCEFVERPGNHLEDEPEIDLVWKSPEAEEKVKTKNVCPVKGDLVWNHTKGEWDLKVDDEPKAS